MHGRDHSDVHRTDQYRQSRGDTKHLKFFYPPFKINKEDKKEVDNKSQDKKLNHTDGNVWWSRTTPQRPGDLYVTDRHRSFDEDGLHESTEVLVAEQPDYFRMPDRPEELGILSGRVMRVTHRSVDPCICGTSHQANRNYGVVENTHIVIIECMTNGFMIGTYDPT